MADAVVLTLRRHEKHEVQGNDYGPRLASSNSKQLASREREGPSSERLAIYCRRGVSGEHFSALVRPRFERIDQEQEGGETSNPRCGYYGRNAPDRRPGPREPTHRGSHG